MTGLRFILCGLTLWLGSTALLPAHQDPLGDTHPQIAVAKGQFQIFFHSYSNALANDGWMRMIYTPDGKLISPRNHVKPDLVQSALGVAAAYLRYAPSDTPTVERVSSEDRDTKITIPSYLVLRTRENGTLKDEPLPFDTSKMTDLKAFHIDAKHAVMLWNSLKENHSEAYDLHLTVFRRGSFTVPKTCDLGPCCTIYDSVASNLVIAGGRVWVAWIRPVDDSPKGVSKSYEAMLGSYDAATDKLEVHKLPGHANWNAHLCLAQTDGWLCAAWHSSKNGDYPGVSEIVTAFEKIPVPQVK